MRAAILVAGLLLGALSGGLHASTSAMETYMLDPDAACGSLAELARDGKAPRDSEESLVAGYCLVVGTKADASSIQRGLEASTTTTSIRRVAAAAKSYLQRNQEAVGLLQTLHSENPGDEAIGVAFAVAQSRTGKRQEALATLQSLAGEPSRRRILTLGYERLVASLAKERCDPAEVLTQAYAVFPTIRPPSSNDVPYGIELLLLSDPGQWPAAFHSAASDYTPDKLSVAAADYAIEFEVSADIIVALQCERLRRALAARDDPAIVTYAIELAWSDEQPTAARNLPPLPESAETAARTLGGRALWAYLFRQASIDKTAKQTEKAQSGYQAAYALAVDSKDRPRAAYAAEALADLGTWGSRGWYETCMKNFGSFDPVGRSRCAFKAGNQIWVVRQDDQISESYRLLLDAADGFGRLSRRCDELEARYVATRTLFASHVEDNQQAVDESLGEFRALPLAESASCDLPAMVFRHSKATYSGDRGSAWTLASLELILDLVAKEGETRRYVAACILLLAEIRRQDDDDLKAKYLAFSNVALALVNDVGDASTRGMFYLELASSEDIWPKRKRLDFAYEAAGTLAGAGDVGGSARALIIQMEIAPVEQLPQIGASLVEALNSVALSPSGVLQVSGLYKDRYQRNGISVPALERLLATARQASVEPAASTSHHRIAVLDSVAIDFDCGVYKEAQFKQLQDATEAYRQRMMEAAEEADKLLRSGLAREALGAAERARNAVKSLGQVIEQAHEKVRSCAGPASTPDLALAGMRTESYLLGSGPLCELELSALSMMGEDERLLAHLAVCEPSYFGLFGGENFVTDVMLPMRGAAFENRLHIAYTAKRTQDGSNAGHGATATRFYLDAHEAQVAPTINDFLGGTADVDDETRAIMALRLVRFCETADCAAQYFSVVDQALIRDPNFALLATLARMDASQEFEASSSWTTPSANELRDRAIAWLDATQGNLRRLLLLQQALPDELSAALQLDEELEANASDEMLAASIAKIDRLHMSLRWVGPYAWTVAAQDRARAANRQIADAEQRRSHSARAYLNTGTETEFALLRLALSSEIALSRPSVTIQSVDPRQRVNETDAILFMNDDWQAYFDSHGRAVIRNEMLDTLALEEQAELLANNLDVPPTLAEQALHDVLGWIPRSRLDKAKRLTIVSPYLDLPFSALVLNSRPLFETLDIVVVPALALLDVLQQRRASRPPPLRALTVLAGSQGVRISDELIGSLSGSLAARDNGLCISETSNEALDRCGSSANTIVAGYGVSSDRYWSRRAFFTAGIATSKTASHAGVLRNFEIAGLDLALGHVTLIVCDASSAGTAEMFLVAGADSVLSSIWKLPQGPQTERFVQLFYEELAAQASTQKDAALAKAQQRAREEGLPSSVWAGWNFIGLQD